MDQLLTSEEAKAEILRIKSRLDRSRRWAPTVAALVAVVAIVILVIVGVTAIGSLRTLVDDDRCRDNERDAFLVSIGHLVEDEIPSSTTVPEDRPTFGESLRRLENINETCGIPEQSDLE